MTAKNCWGRPVPSLSEIIDNDEFAGHLASATAHMLQCDLEIARKIVALASSAEQTYEDQAHTLLVTNQILGDQDRDWAEEVEQLYSLTVPHITGQSLLDFGCGDGTMSRRFSKAGFEVVATDLLGSSAELDSSGVQFVPTNTDGTIPLASTFDSAVCYGVLHHCNEPNVSVSEIARMLRPGGKAVLVESVFGLNATCSQISPQIARTAFAKLSEIQQFLHTMFFDHLVNRIAGSYSSDPRTKVNMPYNYGTTADWSRLFAQYQLTVLHVQHVSLEIGLAPLHHALFVVERA